MLQWHRPAHPSIDRMLAEMTPSSVALRVRGAAESLPQNSLREATLFALSGMSAAERDALADALGIERPRPALGEMFFEAPTSVPAEAVAQRLRDEATSGAIVDFLLKNPRAIGSYEPEFAQQLLQVPAPKRRFWLPRPLLIACAVFAVGAVTALGAVIVPQLGEDDTAPPAGMAAPIVSPVAAHAAPAHQTRAVRGPRRPQPHRVERIALAPAAVQSRASHHFAAQGRRAEHAARTHAQPRRRPGSVAQRQHAAPPTVVAAQAQPTTAAEHVTFWRRVFGWIHVRKRLRSY